MILRDRIQINSPPEVVWHFTADPDFVKSWNAKIKAIVPVSQGRWTEGSRYRIRYAMNGKESNFLVEIMEYREPENLVIHLTGGNLPEGGYAQEIYELSRNDEGTLLTKNIEIYNPETNILWSLFVAFRSRFGKTSTKRYLRRLKKLVEKSKDT